MGERDEQSREDNDWEDLPELRDRLRDHWDHGDMHGFYGLVLGEMQPRLERYLLSTTDLDHDEIEDAIGRGIEKFEKKQQSSSRAEIKDPYNYLFTVVHHAATDIIRERDKDYEVQQVVSDTLGLKPGGRVNHPHPDGHLGNPDAPEADPVEHQSSEPLISSTPSAKWAKAVVEEAVFGIEVEVDWAKLVVQWAISHLPPKQQRVIRHLASEDFDFSVGDFDYKSTRAAEDLDMSPAAFRQNKARAYDSLRQLIPKAIEFFGVVPNVRVAETIFGDRRRPFPSDDDED